MVSDNSDKLDVLDKQKYLGDSVLSGNYDNFK